MAKLSSAAWLVHDLGLAASIGGTLFGRAALQPALYKITRPEERDLVSAEAWQRFSLINLVGHAAFALPWLAGRKKLTGLTVSRRARSLTRMKDIFVIASLVTGVSSVVLSRLLARRGIEGRGPQAVIESERFGHDSPDVARTRAIQRSVGTLGLMNMIATTGVAALTTLLSLERKMTPRWSPLLAMQRKMSPRLAALSELIAKEEAARRDCLDQP